MIVHATILFVAALLGGVMNAVAGGGSFLTFPALITTGVPPISANATNTVALWPGSIATVARESWYTSYQTQTPWRYLHQDGNDKLGTGLASD